VVLIHMPEGTVGVRGRACCLARSPSLHIRHCRWRRAEVTIPKPEGSLRLPTGPGPEASSLSVCPLSGGGGPACLLRGHDAEAGLLLGHARLAVLLPLQHVLRDLLGR